MTLSWLPHNVSHTMATISLSSSSISGAPDIKLDRVGSQYRARCVSHQPTPAERSAIDSYAHKLLKINSTPNVQACIDDSLGSYVTSIFRSSIFCGNEVPAHDTDISSFAEYDDLVELIQEHCMMSSERAGEVLREIYHVVVTGKIRDEYEAMLLSTMSQRIGKGESALLLADRRGRRSMSLDGYTSNKHISSESNVLNFRSSGLIIGGQSLDTYPSSNKTPGTSIGSDLLLNTNLGYLINESIDDHRYQNGFTEPFFEKNDEGESKQNVEITGHRDLVFHSDNKFESPTRSRSPLSSEMNGVLRTSDYALTTDLGIGSVLHAGMQHEINPGSRNVLFPSSSPRKSEPTVETRLQKGEPNSKLAEITETPSKDQCIGFIPTDLLAAMNDPTTPKEAKKIGIDNKGTESPLEMDKREMHLNLSALPSQAKTGNQINVISGPHPNHALHKQCTKRQTPSHNADDVAKDLAASLFRHSNSRSRSNSVSSDCIKLSPKLKPTQSIGRGSMLCQGFGSSGKNSYQEYSGVDVHEQMQVASTIEILLSMNVDIAEAVAREATMVSGGDINVAQYLIDKALSAPPICRHMMHSSCYRSDCHFSHDVEGHTCLFWLRGRCGKGETCRFLHGFGEKLLEGIVTTPIQMNRQIYCRSTSEGRNMPRSNSIVTSNLVEHNSHHINSCRSSTANSLNSESPYLGSLSSSPFSPSALTTGDDIKQGRSSSMGSLIDFRARTRMSSPMVRNFDKNDKHQSFSFLQSSMNQNSIKAAEFFPESRHKVLPQNLVQSAPLKTELSFANIASKGYNEKSSFSNKAENSVCAELTSSTAASNTTKSIASSLGGNINNKDSMRIPQDLWNPNYNRNSNLFNISDPIERYQEVMASSTKRNDVLDLHFQSSKTAPIVLSKILPCKLKSCGNTGGVWIVTGTGHHVNSKSHQKGGGILESVVEAWLKFAGYSFVKGKDRNGFGGAIFVSKR